MAHYRIPVWACGEEGMATLLGSHLPEELMSRLGGKRREMAGTAVIQAETDSQRTPWLTMPPQSGSGGGVPRPRNPKVPMAKAA